MDTTTYTTTSSSAAPDPIFSVLISVVYLLVAVLVIASIWKVFTKAGRPGWAAIIPIYDAYVHLKIIGRPGWWLLLYLIPFVNIAIAIIVSLDTAKSFGKSGVFGIFGLLLFPFVGYPMLAFGSATYQGPSAGGGSAPAAPAAPTPPAAA